MKNTQFKRRIEVLFGRASKKIESPPFTVDFFIEFNSEEDAVTRAQCTTYNIDNTDIRRLDKVIINAGYGNDIGTIFTGEIDYIENETTPTDKIFYMEAYDRIDTWLAMPVRKAYGAGIRAREIVDDLLSTYGLRAGTYILPTDFVYQRGRTLNMSLREALESVLFDCKAGYHISHGMFYIGQSPGRVITHINASTGLIGSPYLISSDRGHRWKIRCLMNHRLQPGSKIHIKSNTLDGEYEVVAGAHACDSDFSTEVEVRKWLDS